VAGPPSRRAVVSSGPMPVTSYSRAADRLRVAQIISTTAAEGPGQRFAIWVQGCPLRCRGCCNPEMLPWRGGRWLAVPELARRVVGTPGISGVTLLGGEPAAQAAACASLLRRVRGAGLSTMVFTGYRVDELEAAGDPALAALLGGTDLLIDGRYERSAPDGERPLIGSRNQTPHVLGAAGGPLLTALIGGARRLELRLGRGGLLLSGCPDAVDRLLQPGEGAP